MIDLTTEIVIHTGDILLICLVQLLINILSFGWGKQAGFALCLHEYEAELRRIEENESNESA